MKNFFLYFILFNCFFILIFSKNKIAEEQEILRIKLDDKLPKEYYELLAKLDVLNFKFNNALPYSEEYNKLMHELFPYLGENSIVKTPITVVHPDRVKIGKNVTVMNNALFMAAGGIEIGDNSMLAAYSKVISNDHDPYDLATITCLPVKIGKYVWVGAGATILKGVTVGDHAIIGGGSIVTKDVPPYAVVVGSPAKIVKYLDKEKFKQ